jgi:hypothetical protein
MTVPHTSLLEARRSPGGVQLLRAAGCAVVALTVLAACAPEVGSARWCAAMRDKPRGDWTANEALEFARHCLFETEDRG